VEEAKVRFTKHAQDKLRLLEAYGFHIDESMVVEAVRNPARLDRRGEQFLVLKPIDDEHALRVVYEVRNDYIVVITLYPVRRKRYGV